MVRAVIELAHTLAPGRGGRGVEGESRPTRRGSSGANRAGLLFARPVTADAMAVMLVGPFAFRHHSAS